MNIKIVSKDLIATDAIKDYIGKKSERLVKYFGEDFDVTATIKTEGGLQVAEMEVKTPTDRFRATTEHKDLYASIDKVSDKIERQIRKNKTRMKKKVNKDLSAPLFVLDFEEPDENNNVIVKRKTIDSKPMSEEEAILQMELLGHEFFAFRNTATNEVNVLYKRKAGNYGILDIK